MLYIFISYCLIINQVAASDSIPGTSKIPSLNGHKFIPMLDSYSPFIFTSVKMGVGLAQTENIEYLAIQIGDYELLSLEGDILFSDASVSYHQRIKDWLGIFVNYKFSARVGAEFSSLFVEGINTVNEFDVGWVMKVYESRKHILSTHFSINNLEAKVINFQDAFENLKEDSMVAVSQTIPSLIGSIGLRYAWAPNPLIGFGLVTELAYGEALIRSETKFFFNLGPRIDIDLSSKTRVPMGIALNYFVTSAPAYVTVKGSNTQALKLKIAYLGANDFIMGIGTAWAKIPTRSSEKNLNAFLGSLELNYFF